MMMPRNEPTENERNLKTLQIDDRMLVAQRLDDERRRAPRRRSRVNSTIVCDWNQSSRSPCSSTNCSDASPAVSSPRPDPVDAAFRLGDVLRIRNEGQRHQKRDDADRHVDVEDQRPAGVVDDPAAQRRPDRRADHRAHAEDRHRRAAPLGGKRFEEDRLRRRLQRAAADALNDAIEDEHPNRVRGAAEERRDGEERERDSVEHLAAEQRRQPAVERHDDDVGQNVAGRDPGDLVDRRAEISADRVDRDVDDRGVDDRHDHPEHHGDGDERDRRALRCRNGLFTRGNCSDVR